MDRIKEGYINVDGYVIGPETTTDELTDLGIDIAVVRVHAHGYLEVLFNKPIVSDGVEFQASVRILKEDDSKVVLLDPKLKSSMKDILDESHMKQEICEEWLKRNVDVEPTRDTDEPTTESSMTSHGDTFTVRRRSTSTSATWKAASSSRTGSKASCRQVATTLQ